MPREPETVRYPADDGAREGLLLRGGPDALLLAAGPDDPPGFWAERLAAVSDGPTRLAPAHGAAPADAEEAARMVAAGVAFLRAEGARRVSVMGAGAGATAAAEAVLAGLTSGIDALILLAPGRLSGPVGHFAGRVVIVSADEDAAVPVAVEQRVLSPGNVQLTVYTGDDAAHALLDGAHGPRLRALIAETLREAP